MLKQNFFNEIDKKKIENIYLIKKTENRRLQDWIDHILVEILEQTNSKQIMLKFSGTFSDGEDVKSAVDNFNKNNIGFYIDLKLNVKEEFKYIHKKKKLLEELFEKAQQESPFEEFRSKQMEDEFKNALSSDFEVNIIATMSSGKSTLVNALLGLELMPEKNEACTSTIVKLTDNDNMERFEARRLDAEGKTINEFTDADLALINKWNEDEITSTIEVEGDIPAIKNNDDMKLVLVDTPGPNNSRNHLHREALVKAIKGKQMSMVFYVLNATQLGTEDDKTLLNIIKDEMEDGGRKAQDRFIFLANKIDNFDPENNGESIESALKNIRDYLKSNGIKNPLIIPVSAELTKLLRYEKYGKEKNLTLKQKNHLLYLKDLFSEEDEMNVLKHVENYISSRTFNKLKSKSNENINELIEIRSGIPVIEELLDDYISKHAIPIQISDAVSSFSTVMAKAYAIEKMNKILNQNQSDLKNIKDQIEAFSNDKKRIKTAEEFRHKVKNEKYNKSSKTIHKLDKIEVKVKKLLDSEQKRFISKCSLSNAKEIFKETEKECDFLFLEIETMLAQSLEKDFYSKMRSLKNEYEQYVINVLKDAFPDNFAIKELQFATMKLPNADKLIEENTSNKDWISTSTWYMPWTWGDGYYTKEVDMSGVFDKLAKDIRKRKEKLLSEFQIKTNENVESSKNILLTQMKKIDIKIKENLDLIEKASKNKSQKQSMINENINNLKWFNSFKEELQTKIISI